VRSTWLSVRNVVGTAGILFAVYVIANAIPDMRRYLRISMM
jgi:hypothetical protein